MTNQCGFTLTVASGVKASAHVSGIAFLELKSGQIFLANAVAKQAWEGIVAGRNLSDISEDIGRDFQIPLDRATRDVDDFADELVRRGIVRKQATGRCPRRGRVRRWEVMWELLLCDVVLRLFGFAHLHRALDKSRPQQIQADAELERQVASEVLSVSRFYWKRVWCLQRSVAIVRLLRKRGISAELVIGYGSRPFFSHAWAEVAGRVIGDSQDFPRMLSVLDRV